MKENEAIEEIKKKICGERPTQHICSDGCMKENDKCALSVAIKALEEVQQYRKIGTVEECRAAVKKQTAKKIIRREAIDEDAESELRDFITRRGMIYSCPTCGSHIAVEEMKNCWECGQLLDWSDEA